MSREYVEREKAIEWFMAFVHMGESDIPAETVISDLKYAIPAADVAPVRYGRWVSVPHKLVRVCSVCNRDEPYKFADIDADVYDYCPHCGSRMLGAVEFRAK